MHQVDAAYSGEGASEAARQTREGRLWSNLFVYYLEAGRMEVRTGPWDTPLLRGLDQPVCRPPCIWTHEGPNQAPWHSALPGVASLGDPILQSC